MQAQVTNEPLGGKPPAGVNSSIEDYDYQLKYMRAFDVADGYLVVKSPSNRIYTTLRSIRKPWSGATIEDAYAHSKTLKMYYLDAPQPTQYIDPSDKRFPSLPVYDEPLFRDIHTIFSAEPVREQDKIIMGYFSYLGIEKGKPFEPDETTMRAMRQAAVDFYSYMQHRLTFQKKSKYC